MPAPSNIEIARSNLRGLSPLEHKGLHLSVVRRIGSIIKQRRIAAGVSEETLAGHTGTDTNHIRRVERGSLHFRVHHLTCILFALRITPQQLYAEVLTGMVDDLQNPLTLNEVSK